MQNKGIHHVSTLVRNIYQAYHFYHHILGLKLTLKTVNQEDSKMYHLFFGDDKGRYGTEFTIFDMPNHNQQRPGTNRLERTVFLVKDYNALVFWKERLAKFKVKYEEIKLIGTKHILNFQDDDGQLLGLTYHDSIQEMYPYTYDTIPNDKAILGIAGIHMRVKKEKELQQILIETFGFQKKSNFLFDDKKIIELEFDNDFKHYIHLIVDDTAPISVMGVGGIHHVAFGVEDKEDLEELVLNLDKIDKHHSRIINRDFMYSLYFKTPNYLIFEVATMEGQRESEMPIQQEILDEIPLFLPSFLECFRNEIEKKLKNRY